MYCHLYFRFPSRLNIRWAPCCVCFRRATGLHFTHNYKKKKTRSSPPRLSPSTDFSKFLPKSLPGALSPRESLLGHSESVDFSEFQSQISPCSPQGSRGASGILRINGFHSISVKIVLWKSKGSRFDSQNHSISLNFHQSYRLEATT